MKCRCGHPIEVHGDRAVFPACEGAHSDAGPLLVVSEWEGREIQSVRMIPRSKNPACECEGFRGV